MILTEKDIVAINQEHEHGRIVNASSLRFAHEYARRTKNWTKGLAYVVRAILIDHVFEDGNKRTAAAVIIAEAESQGFGFDKDRLTKLVVAILRKNITNIKTIEEMVKDVIE